MYEHKEPMTTVKEPEQTSSNHSLIPDNAWTRYRVRVLLCDTRDFTYWWLDPCACNLMPAQPSEWPTVPIMTGVLTLTLFRYIFPF